MDAKFAVYQELFPRDAGPKGKSTRLKILEATVKCYARDGADSFTFDKLAEECGLTRPALFRYFKNYDELLESTVKFVRIRFQEFAISYFSKETTPESQLKAYVKSTQDWVKEYPHDLQFWLYFYFQCSRLPKYRKVNSDLVDMGHERITVFFKQLYPRASSGELGARAKLFQMLITGFLMSVSTEKTSPCLEELADSFSRRALDFAKSF